MVEEEEFEICLLNRNGNSTCKEEDFAELLAARLNGENIESQFSVTSVVPDIATEEPLIPFQSAIQTIDKKGLDVDSSKNLDEGMFI